MDANYVMDETLGTASYDITKLGIGQKKMESFLIGKVRRRRFLSSLITLNCHVGNSTFDLLKW